MLYFLEAVKAYAVSKNDTTFDARLALGLIRSFFTSTRFALQKKFAKAMYLRATYLLEKMLYHGERSWEEFSFEEEILIY